jgi:hypothetical protein
MSGFHFTCSGNCELVVHDPPHLELYWIPSREWGKEKTPAKQ